MSLRRRHPALDNRSTSSASRLPRFVIMTDTARESSHVHWLLLGSLSATPTGRRFVLDNESFAEAFGAAGLRATVDIGPALGAAGDHSITLEFGELKHYAIKHLLASVPVLGELRKLADDLGGPASRRPTPEGAVARVVELIGDGPLATELRKVFSEADAPALASTPAPEPAKDNAALVDELLEQGQPKPATSKAVDSFISAIRGSSAKPPADKPTPAPRRARELVETAVFGATNAILNAPAVTGPEALWRGLKLVVDQCPKRSGMLVEIVDVAPAGLEQAIRECANDEPMNRPDAFFLFERLPGGDQAVELLQSLASVAEDLHAPLVAGIDPTSFGVDEAEDVGQALRDAKPDPSAALPESWAELRADEVSRWLSVVFNDPVVAVEGAGAARRTVFGHPTFVIAAMLAASFRHTGGFARVMGKDGSLKAPGLHEVAKGREAGTTIPLAAFLSIRAQTELAELGIIGLGSGRNTDMIALSAVPTVRGSKDAVPLPAQILTGRVVRFAKWVCDQVPAGTSREQAAKLFTDAATVFLFPGVSEGLARVDAAVIDGPAGPTIRLVATVSPALASIPFEVGFDLPLGVALGD